MNAVCANLILLTMMLGWSSFFSKADEAQSAANALIFVDAPGGGDEFSDSVSVFTPRVESGETLLEETSQLDAGHMISLKSQIVNEKKSLVVKTFNNQEFYEVPTIGGDPLYVSKSDIDVRGFTTGPRTQRNILKESLQVVATSSRATGYLEAPNCKDNKCETTQIPDGTDLIIYDSQHFKVKDENGNEVYKNFLMASDPLSGKRFWIEAALTGFRERDDGSEFSSEEDCNCKNDPIKDLIEQAGEIDVAAGKTGVDALLPHIGHCLAGQTGKQAYIKNLRDKVRKSVKVGSRTLTPDQTEAVDLISRTIYGEMQSCNQHGPQYLEAVGKVILNRKDYIEREGAHGKEFFSSRYSEIAPPFGQIIFKEKAFSIWNKGDPAGENALCPENPHHFKRETVGGRSKGYQPAIDAYKKSVEIALDMVLNEESFADKTSPVKQLFYTSAISMPGRFSESTARQLQSGPIKRKSCLRLWASEPIRTRLRREERNPQYYGLLFW